MEYEKWPSPFYLTLFIYSASLFVQDTFLFLSEGGGLPRQGLVALGCSWKGLPSTARDAEHPSIRQTPKSSPFGQKQFSLYWSRTKLSRSLDWVIFLPGLLQNMWKPDIYSKPDSLPRPWNANFTACVQNKEKHGQLWPFKDTVFFFFPFLTPSKFWLWMIWWEAKSSRPLGALTS